jgi:pilus assembly protein HofO
MMSFMLLTLAWFLLLHPQQQRLDLQMQQQEETGLQLQQRQKQLAARPAIEALEIEIAQLLRRGSESVERQTLENLVTARGTQLENWQPGGQPQQLHLRVQWPQFLPLFGELALARLSVPERFELSAEQGALKTLLWLEDENAE